MTIASQSSASSSTTSTNAVPSLDSVGIALRPQRQLDNERGSLAKHTLHLNATAASLDDLSRDPEAESHSTKFTSVDCPLESLKYLLLVGCVDTDPMVGHPHDGVA